MGKQYRNSAGKLIGKIEGSAFCKKVKRSKHLLRKWNAWGIDKGVLDGLARDGIQKIIIHEKEEDVDYETSVKDFIEKGIEGDFGHGKQIFLCLENFTKEGEQNES